MRVLVACEYSQVVCNAFRARGHDAYSCDIIETEGNPDYHIIACALEVIHGGAFVTQSGKIVTMEKWDMLIAHPECRKLTNTASKHLYIDGKKENGVDPKEWAAMEEAAEFYNRIILKAIFAGIKKICVENPIMHCHARKKVGGRATQYVQPWWFGSKKNKATGLRLIGLEPLKKTNVVGPMPKTVKKGTAEYRSWNECWYMSPGPDRAKKRARTDPAVAYEMAKQWGAS